MFVWVDHKNFGLQAEDDGEKVIILSHRPTDGCLKFWSLNYYNIIMRYEGIIIAQFFGHAHTVLFCIIIYAIVIKLLNMSRSTSYCGYSHHIASATQPFEGQVFG